jgi:hypothetical protein
MTVFSEPGGLPDARGTHASGGAARLSLIVAPSAGSLRPSTQFIELLRRRRAPGIEAPALPAFAVTPILQPAGWKPVEMKEVRRIAFAVLAAASQR